MFTRKIKIQLTVFTVLAIASIFVIAKDYLQVHKMAGIGVSEIVIEFDDASGLYSGAVVTYRGVKVGEVVDLDLDEDRTAVARVEIDTSFDIPTSVEVEAHSTSAIGENYIELLPSSTDGPYLADGDVIASDQTTGIGPTGDLLEGITGVASSIPRRDTAVLLDGIERALGGADHDFDRLLVSSQDLIDAAHADVEALEALISESGPLLETASSVSPEVRAALADLSSFGPALVDAKGDINALLDEMPSAARAVDSLLTDIESDLPILLTDLLTVGQVLEVYLPGVEQILVVYPAVMSAIQAASTGGAPGTIYLGARLSVNQPPNCYTGFLPIAQQRDFHDETQRPDVPDDLYCKVAHDDPRAVRGARNTPCFNVPGVRAASVEECMGREIGSVSDPLPGRRTVAAYDPRNGRVLAPDGQYFEIGGLTSTPMIKGGSWKRLFLK